METNITQINAGGTLYPVNDPNVCDNFEDGNTASKTYNAGEFIVWKGALYKVTTTIASGGTFTDGVNLEPKTIDEALTNDSIVFLAKSTSTSGQTFSIDVTPYDGFIATLTRSNSSFVSVFISKAEMKANLAPHLGPLGKFNSVEYNADVLFDNDVTSLAQITTSANNVICSVFGVKFSR